MPSESAFDCVDAPRSWRRIDFISDLHLHATEAATVAGWLRYLQTTPADALFILGDLFEVWVGDDAIDDPADGFEGTCVRALRAASRRMRIHVMHGNRDFLLGQAFAQAAGVQLLSDPCTLQWQGQRLLLSHGDALCTGDFEYQNWRKTARSAHWQLSFLNRPLDQRRQEARLLRAQSEANKRQQTEYADADPALAKQWLDAASSNHLIHGHTHRPADQDWDAQHRRSVLSDWDLAAKPPRSEALSLSCQRGQVRLERSPLGPGS